MIIDCIADLHGYYPDLPGGDLLIIAGDLTARDTVEQNASFFIWLNEQPYRKKILIAGNHDGFIENNPGWEIGLLRNFDYLQDSGLEFEGLKIWGTPWTPWFENINPRAAHFTLKTEEELAEKYALIPDDTDILISHGPPKNLLDYTADGCSVGSTALRKRLHDIKPQYFICGHIHEEGGKCFYYKKWGKGVRVMNVSHVNEKYVPTNAPRRIIHEKV